MHGAENRRPLASASLQACCGSFPKLSSLPSSLSSRLACLPLVCSPFPSPADVLLRSLHVAVWENAPARTWCLSPRAQVQPWLRDRGCQRPGSCCWFWALSVDPHAPPMPDAPSPSCGSCPELPRQAVGCLLSGPLSTLGGSSASPSHAPHQESSCTCQDAEETRFGILPLGKCNNNNNKSAHCR